MERYSVSQSRTGKQSWTFKGRKARHSGKFSDAIDHENNNYKSQYPHVVQEIKSRLETIREGKAPISVVTARAVILATIMEMDPHILHKTFNDRTTFQASDSYVCAWLHDAMHWSPRKGTCAAHKLPEDWEDKVEHSFLRKVHVIKEYDMLPQFYVNSDQTQMIYAPGDKMTWAVTGAKQVDLTGQEEKCAFMLMVSGIH